MTWKKILLIIFFWPFAIIYYGGKYLIKFYKSSKYTVKQKVIYTIIGVCVLSALGAISASSLNPEIEKVTISDITLYKGTTKKIKSKITPDKVVVKNVEYTSYDPNIISISGEGTINQYSFRAIRYYEQLEDSIEFYYYHQQSKSKTYSQKALDLILKNIKGVPNYIEIAINEFKKSNPRS